MNLEEVNAIDVDENESRNVLFAGCGIGLDAEKHLESFEASARVTAIDPNPQLVEFARMRFGADRRSRMQFAATSLDRFESKMNVYDMVVIGKGEHPSMNRRSVYSSAFELMKPGGKMTSADIAVHDGSLRKLSSEYPYGFGMDALLSKADIEELLLSMGYQSVSITEAHNEDDASLVNVTVQAFK